MILFYNLFLFLYRNGIRIASLFNPKARLWIKGRRNVFRKLRRAKLSSAQKTIWMHSASLGEYEQGKPVLKLLQQKYPQATIVITFFSPSGYEIIKKKNEFEHVYYLPMDSYLHARKWMKIVKPDLVLWVKYEYWYYYLKEIHRKNIPLLLVSGVFRQNQVFFKWYGGIYRKMIGYFSYFFVQNEESQELLSTIAPQHKITVSGDTRCDRVILTEQQFTPLPVIEQFCSGFKTVVGGSTWPADEQVWKHFIATNTDKRFILAPHEIDEENIKRLQELIPGSMRYSAYVENRVSEPAANCLIIDNIGMLSKLYFYADVCYVGGGFGANGLHNVLEAAVFGKPVLFGPYYYKNFEAEELIDSSGGISVSTALELEEVAGRLFENEEERKLRGQAAREYILRNAGASQKVMDWVDGVVWPPTS